MNVPVLLVASSIPALATASVLARRSVHWRAAIKTEFRPIPADVDHTADRPTFEVERRAELLRSMYRQLRYAIDRVLAAMLLVVLCPVLAPIALAIRVDSPGPALFRQRRIGANGKIFTIVKFRTLAVDAPEYSVKVTQHDLSITRVGRFLRRSGLDELPQLWNVLRGEMAIIGPRPEQAALIDLYEPWQRQREAIKPGITGWWQIHHRDDVPLHLNVDKDFYYIRHQGPWIDLLILFGTLRILSGALMSPLALGVPSAQVRMGTELPEGKGS
jgi:lipopolysaccharide/colanic/teichoic acid biosynthesis glycosyltransferase